jgi:hypothetical protein
LKDGIEQLKGNMRNQMRALFFVVSFGLSCVSTSHGMSSLVSMSQEPLWPASATPDGNLVYDITTVGRAGSGLLEVALSASNFPAGVTVTFSPSVLRFTGNQLTAQTARMTVSCPCLMPIDCYPFTITGTAHRETITITNVVCFTPNALAVRVPTLILDNLTNGAFRLRGSGASGKTYQVQVSSNLANPVWTTLGLSIADGNGRFTFFPAAVASSPARFFRAVTTSDPVLVP